jgi:hypothetical protein
MAVTLTYDDTLARVRIDADGLPDTSTTVVERSTDQIRWTTVRGTVEVTAGAFALPHDDYEFTPDVVNYYRVPTPPVFISTGAAAHANNGPVTPGLPAGAAEGHTLLLYAAIRNSGAGTVDVPAGYTQLLAFGNCALFGKIAASGEAAPTVTFTGGVAGATCSAQMCAWSGLALDVVTSDDTTNGSQANIDTPALVSGAMVDNSVVFFLGWREQDWTGVAPITAAVEIGDPSSGLGDNQGIVWDYVIRGDAAAVGADSFVVTGGINGVGRGAAVALRGNGYQTAASITPMLDSVWLKSIARPFLNRPVTVIHGPRISVTRPSRAGIFNIVGRTLPVAVNTVRGSRRWTMFVRTESAEEAEVLDLILASGDVLLVQAPASCRTVKTGYVSVGDTTEDVHPLRPLRTTFTLPMTEVAPPGPDVVGALSTWQSVLNAYATWADVIAANATWADLLTLVGDPSEVIVP